MITLLDENTINKIAAGEVVERPASVVKELVENAMDAGAKAITVEIKEGGIAFIRITDNGCGIEKEQVRTAFLRHATSKIKTAEDLVSVSSLGFRGEALASIAAVGQVEMITKEEGTMTGVRYEIQGGKETGFEEIGCPEGTTIIVRNLFFNTPARKKFLKSAMTEGSYVTELMQRLAMSRPDISFKYILNGQNKLYTTGNGKLKDIIYGIYGRDITSNLLEVHTVCEHIEISGYIAKPFISRGNRTYENYFVNGRYTKGALINKAIEEAYKTFVMIHKYPFTALHFQIKPELLDVNAHPTKMELRYHNSEELFNFIVASIKERLLDQELIPAATTGTAKEEKAENKAASIENQIKNIPLPEPFEAERKKQLYEEKKMTSLNEKNDSVMEEASGYKTEQVQKEEEKQTKMNEFPVKKAVPAEAKEISYDITIDKGQMDFFEEKLLTPEARKKHRLIGQLFKTYWLIEFEDKLFILDQHAAHEKVLYERLMNRLHNKDFYSQQLMPPIMISLNDREKAALLENMDTFCSLGFQIEEFGGNEYMVRGVPEDLFGLLPEDVLIAFIDEFVGNTGKVKLDIFVSHLSTMACKAAIKGNQQITPREADALIDELLTLENPYNCPHGRPTIISISMTELEKKFKRIQS